jgi:hypothetical protein
MRMSTSVVLRWADSRERSRTRAGSSRLAVRIGRGSSPRSVGVAKVDLDGRCHRPASSLRLKYLQIGLSCRGSDARSGPTYTDFRAMPLRSGPWPRDEVAAGPLRLRSFYRFPAAWRNIGFGNDAPRRAEVLRRPQFPAGRRDQRKPVEGWFYGPADSCAIVLVGGRAFAVGSTRIE